MSNGLWSWLKRKMYWLPHLLVVTSDDVLVLLQDRIEVVLRRFDDVDLAGLQRVHRGLLVGHRQPLDAVDLDDLAAGQARGRLGARLVLGIPDVDGLVAGLPFVGLKMKGPEPTNSLICSSAGVSAIALGHDEGIARGLGERLQHDAGRRLQHELEGLGVDRLGLGHLGPQDLAQRIAHRPALERGQHVLGRDGLAVVELEPVAQREGPGELVGRDVPLVDHLRLDLQVVVEREQRVVDHVAVVAHDEGRGPDRIEDLEVRVHDHAQGRWRLACAGGVAGGASAQGGEKSQNPIAHSALITLPLICHRRPPRHPRLPSAPPCRRS